LQGTEYRVVCVDYQFVAAAFRKPAHVVGDGQHSIEELVAEKNQHPWRGKGHINNLSLIEIDELVVSYLQNQGYEPSSVPATGVEVALRKTANLSTGGEAWDVTDTVGPENKALFESIARACDLNVCGIDIMCSSLSEPITQQAQAGVIEVNASPGLRMHHYPIQGTPRDVAGIILKSLLKKVSA
jgi:cyanophycin synthetase